MDRMPLITCENGQIYRVDQLEKNGTDGCVTGLPELDRLLPYQRLARAGVHEVLTGPGEEPGLFFALLLAGAGGVASYELRVTRKHSLATRNSQLATSLVISDPRRLIYPPALAAMGFDLSRLLMLRPRSAAEELWAVTEALRCKGVGAVIAAMGKLTKIEARRLQLAAEQGGGMGVLLRESRQGVVGRRQWAVGREQEEEFFCRLPTADYSLPPAADCRPSTPHAAVTRWLVQPMPGERTVQRWRIQLIHGHGGRLFHPVVLERCRETHSVRTIEPMADRPPAPAAGRVPA
jgi:hypothetical protein